MVFGFDPVEAGLVQSLARPGGNVTGFINLAPELGAKRVELLKETIPAISRVAVLMNASAPTGPPQWKEAERAARLIGIQAQLIEVRSGDELSGAFEVAGRDGRGALLVVQDSLFTTRQAELIDLATRARLPVIYANGEIVRSGGLMSYAPNFPDQYRRAAVYLDRIFKGAKPADLPVEQPSRFELSVTKIRGAVVRKARRSCAIAVFRPFVPRLAGAHSGTTSRCPAAPAPR
jgi:putative ABC transport system substrate-binding protein